MLDRIVVDYQAWVLLTCSPSPRDDSDLPDGWSGLAVMTDYKTGLQYLGTRGTQPETSPASHLESQRRTLQEAGRLGGAEEQAHLVLWLLGERNRAHRWHRSMNTSMSWSCVEGEADFNTANSSCPSL